MPANLHVVDEPRPGVKTETVSQRVRRLQAEARQAAKDHVRHLSAQLLSSAETASDIAGGGEVYPVGVRELASRLVDEIETRIAMLEALAARAP